MVALHPQLAADTSLIGDLSLCRVLLMDDARFPWLILVPAREGARELFDLCADDQLLLMHEISRIAERLRDIHHANKINVAALGNQVPQLHVHIIARFSQDAAWPQPVWCASAPRQRYAAEQLATLVETYQRTLLS